MELVIGFWWVFVAAVSGGVFGLQYRVMKKYTVDNASLLSLFFATIVVPLIAAQILLPGWTQAIADVGFKANFLVYVLGFGWGLGAITYSYSFSILGMALAASILKGLSIAIGSGIPLFRHWTEADPAARVWTILGILMLLAGSTVAGIAGAMREKDEKAAGDHNREDPTASSVIKRTPTTFIIGMFVCFLSGLFSACANLGYEFANPLQAAMGLQETDWRATIIRWMPMYWGGISALLIVQGGNLIRTGNWKRYIAPGSGRDFLLSSFMGCVHFMAQIPYGIGAFYLGSLGTTIGFGANIGMALIVATSIGFYMGEWKKAQKKSVSAIYSSIGILLLAVAVLAYANYLNQTGAAAH